MPTKQTLVTVTARVPLSLRQRIRDHADAHGWKYSATLATIIATGVDALSRPRAFKEGEKARDGVILPTRGR